jgi:hypothetical protein
LRSPGGASGPSTNPNETSPLDTSSTTRGIGGGHPDLGGVLAALDLLRPQADEPVRQQVFGDRQAGRDGQVGAAIGAQRGDAGVELLRGVQHLGGPLHHQFSGGGQLRPAGASRHQRFADEGLHCSHPRRRGLLADPELGRRSAQAAGACNDNEQFEGA